MREVSIILGSIGLLLSVAGIITVLARPTEWQNDVDSSRTAYVVAFALTAFLCNPIGPVVTWVLLIRGPLRQIREARAVRATAPGAPAFVPPTRVESATVDYAVGMLEPLRCANCAAVIPSLEEHRCRGCGAALDWAGSAAAVHRYEQQGRPPAPG
jgi:hypothetical protein